MPWHRAIALRIADLRMSRTGDPFGGARFPDNPAE
jgi:hypothetical protein